MSDPLDAQLLGDWHLADQISAIRRDTDRQLRGAILSLAELAETIDRFCDDPQRDQLPGPWQDGLRLLQAKARQCLADQAVQTILSVGQKLDPRLHLVVEVADDPGEPETIVRQVRPGYLWKDQVLRPAEVVTLRGQGTEDRDRGRGAATEHETPNTKH
jgi:molecular chaperone GrpE (heat shock protein)